MDAENVEDKPVFRGVVYNEMKGVYSSPDSVLAGKASRPCSPDNCFTALIPAAIRKDIPNLTYRAHCRFSRAHYYQPGSARFFFWGDDGEDARRQQAPRARARQTGKPGRQRPFLQNPSPNGVFLKCPTPPRKAGTRHRFTLNWLLPGAATLPGPSSDMLEHILEGLPGSPSAP